MKKLIIVLLFSLSMTAMGQGESGYIEKCYIDSQSKDTIISTYWKHLYYANPYLMNFRMTKINSTYMLDLKYHFGNGEMFTVEKGDSIWIKFAGGFTLPIYAIETVQSSLSGAAIEGEPAGVASIGVTVKYVIPYNKLLALAGNEIEKIRVFSSFGKNDLVIERQYSSTVLKAASLLIKPRKFKVKEINAEVDTW